MLKTCSGFDPLPRRWFRMCCTRTPQLRLYSQKLLLHAKKRSYVPSVSKTCQTSPCWNWSGGRSTRWCWFCILVLITCSKRLAKPLGLHVDGVGIHRDIFFPVVIDPQANIDSILTLALLRDVATLYTGFRRPYILFVLIYKANWRYIYPAIAAYYHVVLHCLWHV